jgi:hypothetical protein
MRFRRRCVFRLRGRSGWLGFFHRRFAAGLGRYTVKRAQFDGDVFVDGAGMRLLLRDAQFGKALEDFMSLDFQLPRQLVDANLLHRTTVFVHLEPRGLHYASRSSTVPDTGPVVSGPAPSSVL